MPTACQVRVDSLPSSRRQPAKFALTTDLLRVTFPFLLFVSLLLIRTRTEIRIRRTAALQAREARP